VWDCHTEAVVGYVMDDNPKTPLITAAIQAAAHNVTLAAGAVLHSDRGNNYTSAEYAGMLTGLEVRHPVERTGCSFNNAMAESFFGILKTELVHRTLYPRRQHAKKDVARYIELRYSTRRIHSALGYRTPGEVHQKYLNPQQAA
jgi:transposase InsO family protein